MPKSESRDSRKGPRENVNQVNVDRILKEQYRKQLLDVKFFTEFSINPFKVGQVITGKPNSLQESIDFEGPEDELMVNQIRQSRLCPTEKYAEAVTSSQEIGWISKPLMDPAERYDPRLCHMRHVTDATRFTEDQLKIFKYPKGKSSWSRGSVRSESRSNKSMTH